MNTPRDPEYEVSAEYLGPVFSLDSRLSKARQNLIFARNGTGKSFLSRAFRYLDLHEQGELRENAAMNLISEESPDAKGAFSFRRGDTVMGSLALSMDEASPKFESDSTIFHVFSEDFVQEELRAHQYELDGDITNQITVDSVNIEINKKREDLRQVTLRVTEETETLNAEFGRERDSQLIETAKIKRNLGAFAALSFETLLGNYSEKPDPPEKSFSSILTDIDALKAIPTNPNYPDSVDAIRIDDVDTTAIGSSLGKITSPSSVSVAIKNKIDAHPEFYKYGVSIIVEEKPHVCPLCEQNIGSPNPKSIIDAYVAYFNDAEEKHKDDLRSFEAALKKKEAELGSSNDRLAQQSARYESLKINLPSMKGTSLNAWDEAAESASASISSLKGQIEKKAKNLSVAHSVPQDKVGDRIVAINRIIEDNNKTAEALTKAIKRSDKERLELQRNACAVFEREFAISHWGAIDRMRALQKIETEKRLELATLERSGPSQKARDRVAETFELLLKEFFDDKYVFDKSTFVLKRGDCPMSRGPHRTLSDGEKTAIAFCYFVACAHKKVKANGDYCRLFLVFDDPITSMSYDFVFAISQTLKNLTISNQGVISVNPKLSAESIAPRPELLILTHSSYFFNITRSNRVVKNGSSFELYDSGQKHELVPLKRFLAPFWQHLRDVYKVANGSEPDHTTGNSVRSVLEAVGRFCRPDKSADLSQFIQHVASEYNIAIKSVLINSLSHGTYGDEVPSPVDLKLACQEALVVVTKYAPGQLAEIEHSSA